MKLILNQNPSPFADGMLLLGKGVNTGAVPKKQPRKTPHVPRQSDPTHVNLSSENIQKLEDLLMEGDLLELTLDETVHIWRLLHVARPSQDSYSEAEVRLVSSFHILLLFSLELAFSSFAYSFFFKKKFNSI